MKTLPLMLGLLLCWCDIGNVAFAQARSASETADTKPCFTCNGAGKARCTAGCKDGLVECPGPCLKLSKGVWQHLEVAGHSPDELWQKFPEADGHWQAWNQGHVGEVIEMQNGKAVNVGKCKICGGTTKAKCAACNGTGQVTCSTCGGKKVVPASWTQFNNPKLKVKPKLIQLKDGRKIVGKVEMTLGSTVYIKTEDGKQVEVNAKDILPDEVGK